MISTRLALQRARIFTDFPARLSPQFLCVFVLFVLKSTRRDRTFICEHVCAEEKSVTRIVYIDCFLFCFLPVFCGTNTRFFEAQGVLSFVLLYFDCQLLLHCVLCVLRTVFLCFPHSHVFSVPCV